MLKQDRLFQRSRKQAQQNLIKRRNLINLYLQNGLPYFYVILVAKKAVIWRKQYIHSKAVKFKFLYGTFETRGVTKTLSKSLSNSKA